MWISREIEPLLSSLAQTKPVLLLTGSRQVGKTSLLQRVFPDYQYVSLDLPSVAEEAEEAGERFLEKHPPPVIIDEVQYAPKLFRSIKARVDRQRNQSGQFLLTGSQKLSLMAHLTESLAGRVTVLDLHSLSLREIEGETGASTTRDTLVQRLFCGGYPEVYSRGIAPPRFFADYVATYLERDVRQVLQVRNLRDFDRFLRLAAVRTGQLFALSSFASDLGMSPNTIKNWLSVLEASGIIFLLPPFYQNFGKRIVKTPKLYFLDTGLACFLAGFRSVQEVHSSELLGALYETLVLGQMLRFFANRGEAVPLYFFRDHQGHEVDFVYAVGEKLALFECKWSETAPSRVKGFEVVTEAVGEQHILSKLVILPTRGSGGTRRDFAVADCVEPIPRELR